MISKEYGVLTSDNEEYEELQGFQACCKLAQKIVTENPLKEAFIVIKYTNTEDYVPG